MTEHLDELHGVAAWRQLVEREVSVGIGERDEPAAVVLDGREHPQAEQVEGVLLATIEQEGVVVARLHQPGIGHSLAGNSGRLVDEAMTQHVLTEQRLVVRMDTAFDEVIRACSGTSAMTVGEKKWPPSPRRAPPVSSRRSCDT